MRSSPEADAGACGACSSEGTLGDCQRGRRCADRCSTRWSAAGCHRAIRCRPSARQLPPGDGACGAAQAPAGTRWRLPVDRAQRCCAGRSSSRRLAPAPPPATSSTGGTRVTPAPAHPFLRRPAPGSTACRPLHRGPAATPNRKLGDVVLPSRAARRSPEGAERRVLPFPAIGERRRACSGHALRARSRTTAGRVARTTAADWEPAARSDSARTGAGQRGRFGESVWLAWFPRDVVRRFALIAVVSRG